MSPHTTVTLREPDEIVEIGQGERFIDLVLEDRLLSFVGETRDSRRDVRSVPWTRVVSIDSREIPVAPPHEHKD
jgi:hypothetical protein